MSNDASKAALIQAIEQIRTLKQALAKHPSANPTPALAIVGMGCRLPGLQQDWRGPQAWYQALCAGEDAIRPTPASRWSAEFTATDPQMPGRGFTGYGGFLRAPDVIDAGLCGVLPREAHGLDPQHALLQVAARDALSDAGYTPESLRGQACGVFVGMSSFDHALLQAQGDPRHAQVDGATGLGSSPSMAAGRLSFMLGLEGPSLVVDTACSSSLVALHLAGRSLQNSECGAALVLGVNLILSPTGMLVFSKLGALAPDGRCKSFDASANGFVRSEGCVAVYVRRLQDALQDGDRIYAVVRGSAMNHDGVKSAVSAPRRAGQTRVIRAAWQAAARAPHEATFFEAHGTGTPLGDSIELQALSEACQGARQPIHVGSAKANLGHTEAAAGLCGLMRAVLCLQARHLPPQLHIKQPTPHVPWETLGLRVAPQGHALPPDGELLAGVSSFGVGGANAHVVLSSAPAHTPKRGPLPLVPLDHARSYRRAEAHSAAPHPHAHVAALLGEPLQLADGQIAMTHRWSADAPELQEHRILGALIAPAALLVLRLHAAAQVAVGIGRAQIEQVALRAPLMLAEQEHREVQILIGQAKDARHALSLSSRRLGADTWTLHATALATPATKHTLEAPADAENTGGAATTFHGLYDDLAKRGFAFGPSFRGLQHAQRQGERVRGDLAPADAWHAGLLDSAWHALAPLMLSNDEGPTAWAPVALEQFDCLPLPPGEALRVHAWHSEDAGHVRVLDHRGACVASTEGLAVRPLSPTALSASDAAPVWRARPRYVALTSAQAPAGRLLLLAGQTQPLAQALHAVAEAVWLEDIEDISRQARPGDTLVVVPDSSSELNDAPPTALRTLPAILRRAQACQPSLRVRVVTQRAVRTAASDAAPWPAHTALLACVRALHRELGAGAIGCVDAPARPTAKDIACVTLWAQNPQVPGALAVRGQQALVPQWEALETSQVTPPHLSGTLLVCGAGQIARALAQHYATLGVEHVVFLSRRGQGPKPGSLPCPHTALRVDASDAAALRCAWASVQAQLPPLRHVVHAAGVLADAPWHALTDDALQSVWEGRAQAAFNLHQLTLDAPQVETFLLSGTLGAVIGSVGQAHYAAACGYLEGLAEHRAAQGLPGQVIHWGPWAGEGAAAHSPLLALLARRGLQGLQQADAMAALPHAASGPLCIAGGTEAQWSAMAAPAPQATARAERPDWVAKLAQEPSAAAQLQAVDKVVGDALSQIMGLTPERIACDRPLGEMGLTSVMALELRDRLQSRTGLRLSATLAFSHPTRQALSALLHSRLVKPSAAASRAAMPEAEQHLRQKLAELAKDP